MSSFRLQKIVRSGTRLDRHSDGEPSTYLSAHCHLSYYIVGVLFSGHVQYPDLSNEQDYPCQPFSDNLRKRQRRNNDEVRVHARGGDVASRSIHVGRGYTMERPSWCLSFSYTHSSPSYRGRIREVEKNSKGLTPVRSRTRSASVHFRFYWYFERSQMTKNKRPHLGYSLLYRACGIRSITRQLQSTPAPKAAGQHVNMRCKESFRKDSPAYPCECEARIGESRVESIMP
ncbi:hypothetical protein C8Q79DRAFT_263941 [Trametes meyenii]|nr:hypothetical protein C8Q79DRAFT_263941 [Trametes meyenii]